MPYCTSCGSPIPEGQGKSCSMCYGDIDYGKDGYYREWAERQQQEDDNQEIQPTGERGWFPRYLKEVKMSIELQIIELLKKAYDKMKDASYQSHNGHWDSMGTRGANCPECNRANKLRKEAAISFDLACKLLKKNSID